MSRPNAFLVGTLGWEWATTPSTPTLALARVSGTSFAATASGVDTGNTVTLYYRAATASAWSTGTRTGNGAIAITGVPENALVYACAIASDGLESSVPSALGVLSLVDPATADLNWTILKRMKTLAEETRQFLQVRLEAGKSFDVALSKCPACVLHVTGPSESRDAEDPQHVVHVNAHIVTSDTDEDNRLERALKLVNDLKNAIQGDATLSKYVPEFDDVEWTEESAPVEHAVFGITAIYYSTATGR